MNQLLASQLSARRKAATLRRASPFPLLRPPRKKSLHFESGRGVSRGARVSAVWGGGEGERDAIAERAVWMMIN